MQASTVPIITRGALGIPANALVGAGEEEDDIDIVRVAETLTEELEDGVPLTVVGSSTCVVFPFPSSP